MCSFNTHKDVRPLALDLPGRLGCLSFISSDFSSKELFLDCTVHGGSSHCSLGQRPIFHHRSCDQFYAGEVFFSRSSTKVPGPLDDLCTWPWTLIQWKECSDWSRPDQMIIPDTQMWKGGWRQGAESVSLDTRTKSWGSSPKENRGVPLKVWVLKRQKLQMPSCESLIHSRQGLLEKKTPVLLLLRSIIWL